MAATAATVKLSGRYNGRYNRFDRIKWPLQRICKPIETNASPYLAMHGEGISAFTASTVELAVGTPSLHNTRLGMFLKAGGVILVVAFGVQARMPFLFWAFGAQPTCASWMHHSCFSSGCWVFRVCCDAAPSSVVRVPFGMTNYKTCCIWLKLCA